MNYFWCWILEKWITLNTTLRTVHLKRRIIVYAKEALYNRRQWFMNGVIQVFQIKVNKCDYSRINPMCIFFLLQYQLMFLNKSASTTWASTSKFFMSPHNSRLI